MFLMNIEKEQANGAPTFVDHSDRVGGFLDLHIPAESPDQ
jgi:hypothetical protein